MSSNKFTCTNCDKKCHFSDRSHDLSFLKDWVCKTCVAQYRAYERTTHEEDVKSYLSESSIPRLPVPVVISISQGDQELRKMFLYVAPDELVDTPDDFDPEKGRLASTGIAHAIAMSIYTGGLEKYGGICEECARFFSWSLLRESLEDGMAVFCQECWWAARKAEADAGLEGA